MLADSACFASAWDSRADEINFQFAAFALNALLFAAAPE
jgi:hypothetical protein